LLCTKNQGIDNNVNIDILKYDKIFIMISQCQIEDPTKCIFTEKRFSVKAKKNEDEWVRFAFFNSIVQRQKGLKYSTGE
jgi:hypothetical protein